MRYHDVRPDFCISGSLYFIQESCYLQSGENYIYYIAVYYKSADYNYTGWDPSDGSSQISIFISGLGLTLLDEMDDVSCPDDRTLGLFGSKYICGQTEVVQVTGNCQLANTLTDDQTITGLADALNPL